MKKSTRNTYVIPLLLLVVACALSTVIWFKSRETFLDIYDLMAGNAVAFYSECNYKGKVVYRKEGRYENIKAMDISSIKIPQGWKVMISTQANAVKFGGGNSSVEFVDDLDCLGGHISVANNSYPWAFADGLTLIIEKIPLPETQLPDTRPTFYTLKNFTGDSVKLNSGWYDTDRIEIPPSSISSIRVPNGRTVKGFERASFKGKSLSIEKDVPDLSKYRHPIIASATWDNRIQSLVVS